jgi:hypothetical protein
MNVTWWELCRGHFYIVCDIIWRILIYPTFVVSEWLLFNGNSAIFQLYHGENKLIFDEMMMRSALYKTNMLTGFQLDFYYTKVKWPNSYKFLWPFVLKGIYSIGQLCPNLPKTYRSFNDILRCGLIHLMQLELNLIFICFKLTYLLWYLELTTRQDFRGHHLFPKKS